MGLARSILAAGMIVAGLVVQACAGHDGYAEPRRARWADEAGSVTVSPISVSRWDDVAGNLQPNFKMNSEIAYQQAIPTTQTLDERMTDALVASLQAGLPSTTRTDITREVTDPDTGLPVTTVENTRTRQSGTAPAAATAPAATAATLAALSAIQIDRDPMLRYLAATALQQEVALLNRYITDRVQWPGAQAFVVRLQLSVIPNGRNMPYDVETDITLHANDEQHRAGLGLPTQLLPPDDRENPATDCRAGSYDTLDVLPMVVTDNLEGLRAARSSDRIRQLALALTATAHGVGAGGQFGRTSQQLRRMEGNETNSLFTVGKLSDDTVRVRLGAVQSPRYGYVTIPRTHNISLVVIYRPCLAAGRDEYLATGPRTLTAVTRTTYRDSDNGRALQYRDAMSRLNADFERLRNKYPGQFTFLEMARLYQWAARQERDRFFDYFRGRHTSSYLRDRPAGARDLCNAPAIPPSIYRQLPYASYQELTEPQDYVAGNSPGRARRPVPDDVTADPMCLTLEQIRYQTVAPALWTDLQSIRLAGEFAYTTIPVRLDPRAPMLPPDQLALVSLGTADGTVTLSQARDLSTQRAVRMTLLGAGGPIPALEANVAPGGRSVTGRFPPLASYGITSRSAYRLEVRVPLAQLGAAACPRGGHLRVDGDECVATYRVRFNAAAAPAPRAAAATPYRITPAAPGIVADATGHGRLNVIVSRTGEGEPSSSLYLSVAGAQLAEIRPVRNFAFLGDERGWKVTAVGEATLVLENLIPSRAVTVSLKDGDAPARSVSVNVIAGAAAQN
ncbi:MAG TPA: hypothetical protein VGW40_11510 [Allosphingosinicella sp.]|nr:hypothetical protein [Allosphingosinicella sp.]